MDDSRPLSTLWRGKLLLAIVVLALLAIACLVSAGTATHLYFENRDSLAHWRGKLETAPEDEAHVGFYSPGRRIARLEEEQQRCVERIFFSLGFLLFPVTLLVLGVRAYRRG